MAKATYWAATDAEARKRGEQTGLDTLVVLGLGPDLPWVDEPSPGNLGPSTPMFLA